VYDLNSCGGEWRALNLMRQGMWRRNHATSGDGAANGVGRPMTLDTVFRISGCVLGLWVGTAHFGQGENQGGFLSPTNPPTHAPAGAVYLGRSVCAQCHPEETAGHQPTPMANTLQPASESDSLRLHPGLAFQASRYSYRILRDGNQFIYSVSDGKESVSEPLLWAVGSGKGAVTYVFQHQGNYYESRVSFYNSIQALDFTTGTPRSHTASPLDAAGARMSLSRVRDCFGCHSTGAVRGGNLALDQLIPGITCEACHGPGDKHVAAVQAGNLEEAKKEVSNPGRLNTEQQLEFCGSCHISFTRAIESGVRGVENVRFQPYRLSNSRCYNPDDRRINCASCHDPHKQDTRDPRSYDSRCLACHARPEGSAASGSKIPPACPVATRDCVSCHMPRYEIPGSHFNFTDHWIRVVKPNEPYPD
jgi:hypothetical protein